jgi:hypothetical protein
MHEKEPTGNKSKGERMSLASALVGTLNEIVANMFSMRTHSPWLTVKEAERYAHACHGTLAEAIRSGKLPAYQRTPRSPLIVNVRSVDEWIRSTWIHTQPEKDKRDGQSHRKDQ